MAAMQPLAIAMIQSQGQAVTLTAPGGSYDVATSTFNETGGQVATIGVPLPLSRGLKHTPGTDIQLGDKQLLLPGNIVQPPVDTKARVDGKDYTIIEVDPVGEENGAAAYFDCIIRGSQ